jgi:hypothetical protein
VLNDFAAFFGSQKATLDKNYALTTILLLRKFTYVTVMIWALSRIDFAFNSGKNGVIGKKAKTMVLLFSLSPRRLKVVAMLYATVMDWKPN